MQIRNSDPFDQLHFQFHHHQTGWHAIGEPYVQHWTAIGWWWCETQTSRQITGKCDHENCLTVVYYAVILVPILNCPRSTYVPEFTAEKNFFGSSVCIDEKNITAKVIVLGMVHHLIYTARQCVLKTEACLSHGWTLNLTIFSVPKFNFSVFLTTNTYQENLESGRQTFTKRSFFAEASQIYFE